jgi:hypothetical protein
MTGRNSLQKQIAYSTKTCNGSTYKESDRVRIGITKSRIDSKEHDRSNKGGFDIQEGVYFAKH